MHVRLEWDGKPTQVERLSLPFQTVETINESRATRQRDEGALDFGAPTSVSERNLLVWGDNQLVMGSLLKEYAGKIKLIYIDPPFDTGADFSVRVNIGDESFTNCRPSLKSTPTATRGAADRRPTSRCSTSGWCSCTSFCPRTARSTFTSRPT